MSIFTEEQAKAILEKVVKLSKADQCSATLAGSVDGNIRFALNNVSTTPTPLGTCTTWRTTGGTSSTGFPRRSRQCAITPWWSQRTGSPRNSR